jgi:hypothetical protein
VGMGYRCADSGLIVLPPCVSAVPWMPYSKKSDGLSGMALS